MRLALPDLAGASMIPGHKPVLLREVMGLLSPVPGGRYLDCTFGGGGHTRAILEAAHGVQVVALDRDPEALARAEVLSDEFAGRFTLKIRNFSDLTGLGGDGFDGILFDFGLSSFQIDDPQRGFSFRADGPADMRMDRRAGRLGRTSSLADVISGAIPARVRHTSRIHPATRSFQGIRIAVNNELAAIPVALQGAFELLRPSGVLCAISFHSLEDRLVKVLFRRWCGQPENSDDATPQDLRTRSAEALTRRPVTPSDEEIEGNPRSRSAKLRAIRKL
jgi:16S rRNA (cytosine1402-N4)-methyltransferase